MLKDMDSQQWFGGILCKEGGKNDVMHNNDPIDDVIVGHNVYS
jgi:hypothetical protein